MLTFKDWIYTHKFSDLELEILKNIELDSIDSFINELGGHDFEIFDANLLSAAIVCHTFLNKFNDTYQWNLVIDVWIGSLKIMLDFNITVSRIIIYMLQQVMQILLLIPCLV